MTTKFGELVRQVGGLKSLIKGGVVPGALACSLVVSSMAFAQTEPLASPVWQHASTSDRDSAFFAKMQVELDQAALNYYQTAIVAMAKADLSKLAPSQGMYVLEQMAKETIANAPSRGDVVQGPSSVKGLDLAMAFFAQFSPGDYPSAVQQRAAAVVQAEGFDLTKFAFEGIQAELKKANDVKVEALNEVADKATQSRRYSMEDLVGIAMEGGFDRHATSRALLNALAATALVDETQSDAERDGIIREVNRGMILQGTLNLISNHLTREGNWTDRTWARQAALRGIERAEAVAPQVAPAFKP